MVSGFNMSADLYLILAVILAGFGVTLVLVRYWLTRQPATDPLLAEWLKSSTGQINQRLDSATELMASVQKNLGEMSEVGRGIRSLQDFLQSPKLRGGIGEQVMQDMIGQSFPKSSFHFQYGFRSGVKVDAVIKTDAGLLCIDSKFPLSNFNQMVKGESEIIRNQAKKDFISDVKKHITDISQKYILPEEGTMDFALMFVPSEAVYYEVVNTEEIMKEARNNRVYPVSPTTFSAHLQVILTSYQGKSLEEKTKAVFNLLRAVQKDYSQVEDNLLVLNRHLTNAYNQMGNVTSRFSALGQKLSRTHKLTDGEKDKVSELE
jgi:DNA recombination protein RmuC